jgi:hypothetical protein
MNKFPAESGVNVLPRKRREKPSGAFKQISISRLYAGVFFSRHRVPRQKSLPRATPETFGGAPNNVHLGAADVGYKNLSRQRRSKSTDQVKNRKHRCCQHHHITGLHSIGRICDSVVNGATFLGPLQNRRAIATHDARGEVALLERKPERPSDQAGSDDGALPEGHGKLVIDD